MKAIILILLLPLCSYGQYHPSALLETSTTFDHIGASAMYGFTNFQDDSFHAGFLYKHYGEKSRKAVRVNVNLNLNRTMFVFIQSDIFANTPRDNNASFMENSAGLGFKYKSVSLVFGYQMEDYNPVTEIRSEDRPNMKISYKFKL